MKTFAEKLKKIRNQSYLNINNHLPCAKCNIRGVCPEYKRGATCALGKKIIGDRVKGGLDPVDIVEDQILKLYEEVVRLQLSSDEVKAKETLNKMITNIGNLAGKKFKMENTPRLDIDVHVDIFDLIKQADEKIKENDVDKTD